MSKKELQWLNSIFVSIMSTLNTQRRNRSSKCMLFWLLITLSIKVPSDDPVVVVGAGVVVVSSVVEVVAVVVVVGPSVVVVDEPGVSVQ